MSWPIGTKVQWAEKMRGPGVSAWVGEVTGHPQPRMVEVDGRGAISVGLLEVFGEMSDTSEIEALQAVIVQQAEAMARMVPSEALDDLRDEVERLREAADNWDNVPAYLSEVLSEVMGSYAPASLEGCPLRSVKRLAEFVRGE